MGLEPSKQHIHTLYQDKKNNIMDRDSTQQPRPSTNSLICRGDNCNFFGNDATDGFCSVCYQKDLERRKQSLSEVADVISPKQREQINSVEVFENTSSSVAKIDENEKEEEESSPKPKKAKKAKCGMCKKKLGLTGFECKCGKQFCSVHRYSDKHNCSFDYMTEGKDLLRKANPVVQDSKISQI